MNEFINSLPAKLVQLKQSPELEVILVTGNESCDLDSAICALTMAHHLSDQAFALPMLNIPREDVSLRTEVEFCLGKTLLSKLPTRDEIEFEKLENVRLVLVDHHKLIEELAFLSSKISKIIDHRQEDPEAVFPKNCHKNIQLVGSCATLVSEELLNHGYRDDIGLALLRDTIIVDTVNLSPEVKKATDLDKEQLKQIEIALGMEKSIAYQSRKDRLKLIGRAKGSIEGFTTDQILRKDLKLVTFCNGIRAAVPSTLRLAYDLCQEDKQIVSIFEHFCQKYKVQLLIIVAHQKKKRDILLYQASDHTQELIVRQIVNALVQHEEIKISVMTRL